MNAKPIMVVHPDVATSAVKQVLRRAGYAVVVSERPDLFSSIEALPVGSIDVLFRAAMRTIKDNAYGAERRFGSLVAQEMFRISTQGDDQP